MENRVVVCERRDRVVSFDAMARGDVIVDEEES